MRSAIERNYGKWRAMPGPLKMLAAGVVLLAVLNLALLHGLFLSPRGVQGFRRLQHQVQSLEQANRELRRENAKLFEKIRKMKSDPVFQEKQVREQLGWTREDEWVVEFPPSGEPSE